MNARHALLWSCLLPLLILAGVYLTCGMYLEDNESIVAAINYGIWGELGWEQFFSDYQTPFLPLLYHASRILPGIPVFGLWKLFFAYAVLTASVYYIFRQLELQKVSSSLTVLTAAAVLVALNFDSFFYQHCVRHSILLGFLALLLNWQAMEAGEKKSMPALFVFLLAVISRMHAAAILLALFMAFHFLRGRGLREILRRHAAMLALAGSFIFTYQLYGIFTSNMGKYIEAHYEYVLLEKAALHPIENMQTPRDSMKYIAVQNFLITDSAEITKDFLARVADVNYSEQPLFSSTRVATAWRELYQKFQYFRWRLLMLPVILLLLFISGFSFSRVRDTLLFSFLALSVLFGLVWILVDDMKLRFFSPFIGMSLFTLFMLHFPLFVKRFELQGARVLASGILLFFVGSGIQLLEQAREEKQQDAMRMEGALKLHAYSEQHPLLAFMGAEIPFISALFYRTPPERYRNLASFDGGYLIYFSYLKKKFEHLFECSPLDYAALIRLFQTHTALRFYSTPERIALIADYFAVVYNTQLEFTAVEPQPELGLNGTIFSVRIASTSSQH